MKKILVKDIVNICKGRLLFGNEETVCENFSKDTRNIQEGDIYLGIQGEKVNGSLFYEEALLKGAKGCILQDVEIDAKIMQQYVDRFMILVPNVVKALQELASYKRSLYAIPVIGITGSVGKTSTKDMIASVLATQYDVLKTEGNYNNEIGLPLTILRLKEHNAMVLEMGMSALGEIRLLTNIAKPTTAVITVIGSSHIGELGSRKNILKAKLEILEGLKNNGSFIMNNDNDLLHQWTLGNHDHHPHITYGIENESQYLAKNIQMEENESIFELELEGKTYTIKVPVPGKHFIYNALAAIAVGIENHITMENIIKGIAMFSLTKKRMELLKIKENVTIINDCYNASYESVKVALEYVHSLKAHQKIAVLGDVLELGAFSKEFHQKIGKEVANNKIDMLITVGIEAEEIARAAKEGNENIEVYRFEQNKQAIALLKEKIKPNDIILIKASNGMHFDEIVEALKIN